jgi:hypothetical protein
MRVRVRRVCTHMTRVIGLVAITSLIPLPAFAGDAPTGKPMTIKASAAQIVARDVAASPARPARVREERQGTTSTNSTPFFKTTPAIIALSVMAVGTGYALYSAQHDRIHSAGKK